MNIDWSKAPEGATHWDPFDKNWLRQFGGLAFNWLESPGEWVRKGWQYPDELSIMPRLIARPTWSGEGLPPVGTVCEYNTGLKFDQCLIEAYAKEQVVFSCPDYCEPNRLFINRPKDCNFRPIRTPEQIAAEERAAGIQAVKDDYAYTIGSCTHKLAHEQAVRIYDCGYRKQTIDQ